MRDWLLLVSGTGLGVVSLIADLVGLGGYRGFGWKQTLGTATALLMVAWAAARILRRDRRQLDRPQRDRGQRDP